MLTALQVIFRRDEMQTQAQRGTENGKPGTDFVTVAEAAEILRLSQVSVRRFLTQKRLTRYKVDRSKKTSRTLLKRSEVLSLVREA
jgi:Helix-turn-helix domain